MPRPRAFDEASLLDAAIELFWVSGYRVTSLAEVSTTSGVTNGSLYQAYGSKRALFLAAYRRYCERRVATVAGVFVDGRDGVEQTVNAYFEAIVEECLSYPDRRGCLMLNTISELGSDEEVGRITTATIDAMEAAVGDALRRVAPASSDPEVIAVSAAQTVALSQALIHLSRAGRDRGSLRRIGAQAATSTGRLLLAA
ncbi:MAG TPA: TetR/AcrR family transcriptional regulator [Plantibacter sp.]|uniref:TetR/AcrR family transcriptional regulator n=1 Tax=unclassified Plantibacter TaxID=2624265 RepID=UPI002CFC4DB8|nr:TetR/AcrR family transcriptional regulator [Plantibacter sp.]